MNVPLLDLQAQYATIKDKVQAALDEVFSSQRFVLGTHVAALEKEIAKISLGSTSLFSVKYLTLP